MTCYAYIHACSSIQVYVLMPYTIMAQPLSPYAFWRYVVPHIRDEDIRALEEVNPALVASLGDMRPCLLNCKEFQEQSDLELGIHHIKVHKSRGCKCPTSALLNVSSDKETMDYVKSSYGSFDVKDAYQRAARLGRIENINQLYSDHGITTDTNPLEAILTKGLSSELDISRFNADFVSTPEGQRGISNHLESVKWLVENRPHSAFLENYLYSSETSCFAWACEKGEINNVVEYLLEVYKQYPRSANQVAIAALRSLDVAKKLFDRLNRPPLGNTKIDMTALYEDDGLEALQWLLKQGVVFQMSQEGVEQMLKNHEDPRIVPWLAKNGPVPLVLLKELCRRGKLDSIRGASVTPDSDALELACANDTVENVAWLCTEFDSPLSTSVLLSALFQEKFDVAEWLVKNTEISGPIPVDHYKQICTEDRLDILEWVYKYAPKLIVFSYLLHVEILSLCKTTDIPEWMWDTYGAPHKSEMSRLLRGAMREKSWLLCDWAVSKIDNPDTVILPYAHIPAVLEWYLQSHTPKKPFDYFKKLQAMPDQKESLDLLLKKVNPSKETMQSWVEAVNRHGLVGKHAWENHMFSNLFSAWLMSV